MKIRHRHTSLGDCGLWWVTDGHGEAHGVWWVGSWRITSNTTAIPDYDIDTMLDSTAFWPGIPADGKWYEAEWTGAELTAVG